MSRSTSLWAYLAFLTALLCAVMLFPASGHAGTGKLNDSGLSLCFDGANMVACTVANTGDAAAFPRQDARFGRDSAQANGVLPPKTGGGIAGFDFTKVANDGSVQNSAVAVGNNPTDWKCTRDNVTGLLWSAVTENSGNIVAWNQTTFLGYVTAANSETLGGGTGRCGKTGWRLPTERELHSIVNHGATAAPHTVTGYFPNITAGTSIYWSDESRIDAESPCGSPNNCAWAVAFDTGEAWSATKASTYRVMLVSDEGAATPAASFTDNGNGTVSDNVTGLMWMKCSRGTAYQPGTNDCAAGTLQGFNWQAALAEAVAANGSGGTFGYTDWRLPNTKELETLMRYDLNPTIDQAFFPLPILQAAPWGQFWSSTIATASIANAFYADFRIGGVFTVARSQQRHVRLVRGGPAYDPFDNQGINIIAASVTAIAQTAATLNATADKTGTGHWIVVTAGSTPPTPAQIVAGTYTPMIGSLVASGSGAMAAANTSYPFSLTGLTIGTTYDVYVVAEDGTQMSSEWKLTFTTLGAGLTAGIGATNVTETAATLNGWASLAGSTGYWIVVPTGSPVPTTAEVMTGTYGGTVIASGSGALPNASIVVPFPCSGLTHSTTYDVHFVAENGALRAQVQTSFSTPVPGSTPQPPVNPPPVPPDASEIIDGSTLTGGGDYIAIVGSAGRRFCLPDPVPPETRGVTVGIYLNRAKIFAAALLPKTCFEIVETRRRGYDGSSPGYGLVLISGKAWMQGVYNGSTTLVSRNEDLAIARETLSELIVTYNANCTSTRVQVVKGKFDIPEWWTTPAPANACPSDALTPERSIYPIADGTLACKDWLQIRGTYPKLTLFLSTSALPAGQQIYLAARYPAAASGIPWDLWFQNNQPYSWQPSLDPFLPLHSVAVASDSVDVDIIRKLNVTGVIGTELYVGHGASVQEMMDARRYCALFRLSPPEAQPVPAN